MRSKHNYETDHLHADRLDAAWNAATERDPVQAIDAEPVLTQQLQRVHAGLAAPEPTPEFLSELRCKLVAPQPREHAPAASARLGFAAVPAMPHVRPAIGRMAAVAAILALVLGAVFAVAWPAKDGDAPLVASALASGEARTPLADPTSTALRSTTGPRTVRATVSLWEAPAIGTPHAALSPSTPVELLGETTGRQGERWLHVHAADGTTGWVRAQDVIVMAGDR
ncbi:MAG: SH3 domain-containing protein [Thermomicrobiales bacterium]